MKPRSYEVTDGNERAPARAMLRAVGMTDGDWDKAQVGVASSWNEVTPVQHAARPAGEAGEGGRPRGGRLPARVRDHRGERRHLDGSRGHARLAREPRDHLRLGRVRDALGAVRRARHVRRAATRASPACSWPRRGSTCPSVFLYGGSILPGHYQGQALDVVSVFEAVGACAAGTITENELGEIERRACPTEGSCAGMFTANTMASVGEAHRDVAARERVAAGGRPSPRRRRVRVGQGGDEPPRPEHPGTRHHDEGGVRERDRGGDGARWLDERGAAPARDRARGARRARARRLQPHRRAGAAPRRHEAARQVPHGRRRRDRRCSRRHAGAARRRAAPRRRDDRHRQDDGGEPRRPRPARARRRRDPPAVGADPRPGRPRDPHRFARAEGQRGEGRRDRRAAVRGHGARVRRRGRRDGGDPRRSDPGGRRRGDPVRGARRAAPACARCSPSPAR